jgi:hypothetical protein
MVNVTFPRIWAGIWDFGAQSLGGRQCQRERAISRMGRLVAPTRQR